MTELQAAYLARFDTALSIGVAGLVIVILLLSLLAIRSFRS